MQPTIHQLKAATTLDRHLAVTAGPGSGKTRVLVERYLNILDEDLARIENIVAITFTNKAANEMRERLRRQIDAYIEKHRRTRFEAYWRDVKRKLEGAVITTIHGFCSRILRENPVEAVVDPQFATLDEYSASVLLDGAAQAAVTDLIDKDDPHGAWLVAAYGRSTLVDHLTRTYNTLRGLGIDPEDAHRRSIDLLGTNAAYLQHVASIDSLVNRAYVLLDDAGRGVPATNARLKIDAFTSVWREVRTSLEAEPAPDRVQLFAQAIRRLQLSAPPKTIVKQLKPWVDDLRAVLGEKTERSSPGTLQLAYFDVLGRPFTDTFFETIKALDSLYAVEKRAVSALDYEDLQLRVRRLLTEHPRVASRIRTRYRYFLVDEFQDTNLLQREIIESMALGEPVANLFVVGDRKQSIYGFRGAEVQVFRQTVVSLLGRGGEEVPLSVNFRSDPRLVAFFNEIFSRLMDPEAFTSLGDLDTLGFVEHEQGLSHREPVETMPAVECLLHLPAEPDDEAQTPGESDDDESTREREARMLAARLREMVDRAEAIVLDRAAPGDQVVARAARWGDMAILFRAMTEVKTYERALRKAGIPYYVVAGKGFYDRPETRDLLNLLEFLDNREDELSLAAILRSPLFGVSDETLLALRVDRLTRPPRQYAATSARTLWQAVESHQDNPLVSESQHWALEEAKVTLARLGELRNRLPISDLLAEALALTHYETVAAAADDGAQRLSNIDKLTSIARQFERGAMRLLRDFIDYIRDFRRLEAREAEANLRSNENAVALLTIHKSKGLEFPIVVLPDLQRRMGGGRSGMLVDRELGVAFRVPDGSGGLTPTSLYSHAVERRSTRDLFESIRLFFVAATRAQDHLVLSGASTKRPGGDAKGLSECTSWLDWVVHALRITSETLPLERADLDLGSARVTVIGPNAEFHRGERRGDEKASLAAGEAREPTAGLDILRVVDRLGLLLGPVVPESDAIQRYSATALQRFVNCPRQFYFMRLLRVPNLDAAGRDGSELPDATSAMTASLRGLVVHRFCETYKQEDNLEETLKRALDDVISTRGDAYSDLMARLDSSRALAELLPIARNYVASRMRMRVDDRLAASQRLPDGRFEYVLSELPFTLRVEHGFLFGAIDKLLFWPLASGRRRALLVDFKTNWLPRDPGKQKVAIERLATEYQLQMQIYATAVRQLFPDVAAVEAVLHFLSAGPNVEYSIPAELLTPDRTRRDVNRSLAAIIEGGYDPTSFEARAGDRCRQCSFRLICPDAAPEVDEIAEHSAVDG